MYYSHNNYLFYHVACGLENCVECKLDHSEGGRANATCTACIANTVLFNGRCYACPLSVIARVAIKQTEEERLELANQQRTNINGISYFQVHRVHNIITKGSPTMPNLTLLDDWPKCPRKMTTITKTMTMTNSLSLFYSTYIILLRWISLFTKFKSAPLYPYLKSYHITVPETKTDSQFTGVYTVRTSPITRTIIHYYRFKAEELGPGC